METQQMLCAGFSTLVSLTILLSWCNVYGTAFLNQARPGLSDSLPHLLAAQPTASSSDSAHYPRLDLMSPILGPGATKVRCGNNIAGEMLFEGLQRTFLVDIPASFCAPPAADVKPAPLWLMLHGYTKRPAGVPILDARHGFVGVRPAGWKRSWNANHCCGEALAKKVNDVGFLQALVHHIHASYFPVRADGIFLSGFSNGGYMSEYAITSGATMFRAISPAAGHQATGFANVARPTPVLMEHGDADEVVSFTGCCAARPGCCCQISKNTPVCLTVEQIFAEWRKVNRCSDGEPVVSHEDVKLKCTTGLSCVANTTLCVQKGGSHTYPNRDFHQRQAGFFQAILDGV